MPKISDLKKMMSRDEVHHEAHGLLLAKVKRKINPERKQTITIPATDSIRTKKRFILLVEIAR